MERKLFKNRVSNQLFMKVYFNNSTSAFSFSSAVKLQLFVFQEDRLDPMIYIFPRMTKCTFHKFGATGEVEKLDALCILPLNIVNEKIYIFIWFWFLILGALSALVNSRS